MIVSIGVDLVNIGRFAGIVKANPALVRRIFTPEEQGLALPSLAARFAAKEAVAKALGAPAGLVWKDCSISRDQQGAPHIQTYGTVARRAAELKINRWHLSISHDEPMAIAQVIAEHLSQEELALLDSQPSSKQ